MYCKVCGYELNENWNICPNCCKALDNSRFTNTETFQQEEVLEKEEKQNTPKSDGNEKIYLIIFLVSIALGAVIEQIMGICYIVALITIVTGFIKCPHNRAIKVLFWLFVAGTIIFLLFIIIIIFFCASLISSCGYSCS